MKIKTIFEDVSLYEYFISFPLSFFNIVEKQQYLLYIFIFPFYLLILIATIISFPIVFIMTLKFIGDKN